MSEVIKIAKREVVKLENLIAKIDDFMNNAPEGCLKWQNKNGKTYYYHQFKLDDNKWGREYVKKEEPSLANKLALKHYYSLIKPIVKNKLEELEKFVRNYPSNDLEEVYDSLCPERKKLCVPLCRSAKSQLAQWYEEVFESATMYPENLRYETEQGEMVRSKSELIIANILYRNHKDILYKYERPLELICDGQKKTIYPDFTIINIHTGKIKYWEHAGRLDDTHYASEFVKKMNTYTSNGLLPGKDVVCTFETKSSPLDVGVVKKLIKQLLDS